MNMFKSLNSIHLASSVLQSSCSACNFGVVFDPTLYTRLCISVNHFLQSLLTLQISLYSTRSILTFSFYLFRVQVRLLVGALFLLLAPNSGILFHQRFACKVCSDP